MEAPTREQALQRGRLLFGLEAEQRLAQARVIVFGLGGVGSWCAEALVRAGVGHITLVDSDTVDVSNLNRQLPATLNTIGRPKAEVMAERLRTLMPGVDAEAKVAYYDEATADAFGIGGYDAVVDAIDSLASKAHLIRLATSLGVPLFSSMGAAQRTDPARVKDAEFWQATGCPLARALRSRFKRSGEYPARKFRVVYSDEPLTGQPKGSTMAITATFGLRLAALALARLTAWR